MRPPHQRVAIPSLSQGKGPRETLVKTLAGCNDRIKSYGPFEMVI